MVDRYWGALVALMIGVSFAFNVLAFGRLYTLHAPRGSGPWLPFLTTLVVNVALAAAIYGDLRARGLERGVRLLYPLGCLSLGWLVGVVYVAARLIESRRPAGR